MSLCGRNLPQVEHQGVRLRSLQSARYQFSRSVRSFLRKGLELIPQLDKAFFARLFPLRRLATLTKVWDSSQNHFNDPNIARCLGSDNILVLEFVDLGIRIANFQISTARPQ